MDRNLLISKKLFSIFDCPKMVVNTGSANLQVDYSTPVWAIKGHDFYGASIDTLNLEWAEDNEQD